MPPSTNAMLTVNSPLRLINSFVPSKGSTIQSVFQDERSAKGTISPSSLKTGKGVAERIMDMIL